MLRADALARHLDLQRMGCSAGVAPWVEGYWGLRWSLPDGASFVSQVVVHPSCSLTVERGHPRPELGPDPVVVTGVVTTRFETELSGSGWVLGVKFRPGGLAALTGLSARPWRDRVLPAAEVLPLRVVDLLRGLVDDRPVVDQARNLDDALGGIRPVDDDPRYTKVLRIVTMMLGDRSLLTVAEVEDRCGLSARALQRLFERYLGVGPKWVLARYRIHDAVTELDTGYDGSLIDLAHRYGWYDQAHFTRDFTGTTGVSPGEYRARDRSS